MNLWPAYSTFVLPTACLQQYLDALPSGEYFEKGYQVVATDGSLRLNRSSTKEPAMGAGVTWLDAAIPHRSERVGSQHSSTRAELAAVVMALQGTPRADDLAILIDSAAAIQRLRWFRSHDFRPAEHKVKDYDIIHDILLELKWRSESSSRTLFVKVHGHSGDPLHKEADRHNATYCIALQHTPHTAAHCNILQHTETHCNKLQHRDIPVGRTS